MASRRAHIALALAVLVGAARCAGAAEVVAIVTTGPSPPFEQATTALVETLRHGRPQAEIRRFDLEGNEANAAAVLARTHETQPALVITVGSLATSVVLKETWPVPVVFSMVLYPQQSGYAPGRNVTGIELDVPLDTQFATLREILPTARRVGVLYHHDETGSVVASARLVAGQHGFVLDTKEVDEPSSVPTVLPSFAAGVDVLWTVADSHVLDGHSTPALILEALRMGVPVFGLSAPQVHAGALAAFAYDYADIGVQSGELASRVLAGEASANLPPVGPRKLSLTLNLRSAHYLNVTIPPEIEHRAGEVIQ